MSCRVKAAAIGIYLLFLAVYLWVGFALAE